MSQPKPVPNSHLFFAAGCAVDAAGHRFYQCLPGAPGAALNPAQHLTIYLLVTACGITGAQAARAFGVDASRISRINTAVVNRRDDVPMFDDSLSAAERLCMATFGTGPK